jgi:hypothetical protein
MIKPQGTRPRLDFVWLCGMATVDAKPVNEALPPPEAPVPHKRAGRVRISPPQRPIVAVPADSTNTSISSIHTMSSFHMTPEFSFVTWPGIFPPTEDYNAILSDYADNAQSSAVYGPFLGGLVSLVLCGISKVTHAFVSQDVHDVDPLGNPSNGAVFPNIAAADAAVFTSPVPQIYMEDFINNLDEVNEVSIPSLVLDRAH